MSNVEVRLRVESKIKRDAEAIFKNMGMSMSEAIRVFLKQSINSSGLPFRPHLKEVNKTTTQAFKTVEGGNYEEISGGDFSNYVKELDNEGN